MPAEFVAAVEATDAGAIEQQIHDELRVAFSDWAPAASGLDSLLIKAPARLHATVKDTAASTSAAMFKTVGDLRARVPPILAAPATGTSTWTMVDDAVFSIPAGTRIKVPAAGDKSLGFEVVEEVVVPPGSTTTAAGGVSPRAMGPGRGG